MAEVHEGLRENTLALSYPLDGCFEQGDALKF